MISRIFDHPNVYTCFLEYPPQPLFWYPAALKAANVYAVALDPQNPEVAYLGAANGVYTSTDNAVTWTRTSTGLADAPVTALAVDPQQPSNVFAGTAGAGLFKSTDAGQSWGAANNGLAATEINEIDINPLNPSISFLETPDGVFRNTDGGTSRPRRPACSAAPTRAAYGHPPPTASTHRDCW